MEMVKVYLFQGYDIASDRVMTSKRPATMETIKLFNGSPIMNRCWDVDRTNLDGNGFYRGQLEPSSGPAR